MPKTMVTSANKIVSLSGRGIAVTSENAKYLVRYLADVENANEEHIAVQYSTCLLYTSNYVRAVPAGNRAAFHI